MRLFDEPLRAWLGSRLLLGRTSGSVPVPPIGSEAH
jgi:hypothetical protein